MKKKYLAPVAIALIATISITTVSCGKPADEEVNATEAEVTTTVESTEETTAPETTETETTVEETTVAETTKEETTPATESASSNTEKNTETTAAKKETKSTAKTSTQAAPKAEAPKAPAPTQAAPAPTQAPAPAHEHQWKEHKATRQEWVSNIVSVPDYETREQTFTFIICNCGAEFRADDSSFAAHTSAHVFAGEDSGYWSEVRVVGTETVQVGSHDEDQGYYQNVEYTDYHYCDCGATK